MKKLFLSKVLVLFLILLFLPFGAANAGTILYEATDLVDTTPGEDLWMYSYVLNGFTFFENYGFQIFFDYMLYSNLEDPPPLVNLDWDPIVFQPDLGLPDDGIYDALALVDNPSLADPFTVSFVWLGAGSPGTQLYEIYNENFDIIATGETTVIPEPTTIILLGSGLLSLAGLRRKIFS